MRGRNNSSKERTRRPDKRGEFIGWSRNEILLTSRTANYARVFTELFRDHRQRVVYWSFRSSTVHGHTTRRLILRRTEGFIQISTVFRRCTFFLFHFSASFSVCLCNQFRIRKILFPDYQWSRNSPRNCSHFSHKRAIMQAKPACKHFIFQTVAFPFETPESDRNFWSLRSLYHRHHFLPSIKFGIIRIPANPYCRFLAAIYAVYYNRPRVTISFIHGVAPTRSYFNINNWLTCRETCSSSVKLILNFNVLYILYRKLLGKKRK